MSDNPLLTINDNPIEHIDAVRVAIYLRKLEEKGTVELFAHVPNETYTTSWSQKAKNKAEGVRSGIPDYIIVTATKVIFLELKRRKGGTVRPDQKMWLSSLGGKETITGVANGYDEAKAFIDLHVTDV